MKDILVTQPTNIGSIDMQMVYSSPLLVERSISDIIVELILRAKKNIRLVTPYFLPIEDVMNALLIAAKTGIKIELIFPGKRDNKNFILTMNRHGYEKLMELGCKIYEYHGFIHSKYLIIDDRFIFTGSNNLDIRSLTINFENCLLIENDNYAKQLINLFEKDRLNSKMVNINEINTLIKSFRHR
jgi:cardiolipin synthase